MRSMRLRIAIVLSLIGWSSPVLGDPVDLQHSDWEFYHAGIVAVEGNPDQHGAAMLYDHAPPVPSPGSKWTRLTGDETDERNPVDINYLGPNGDYSSNLRTCSTEVDFAYFQTFVTVPAGFRMGSASIAMGPLDDGARVVIYNSAHTTGFTPEDGYFFLGDSRTIDLLSLLKSGETNRVVIQHVDDCAAQGWLGRVVLNVSGQQGSVSGKESWGKLKARYR